MAINANSYGTVLGVAALARRWTNAAGTFDTTTKPTLAQVESWIDQNSGTINVTLAGCRYTTLPITEGTVVFSFASFVNQITADMVAGSHDIGRLGPTSLSNNRGRIHTMYRIVAGEVSEWIRDQCDAFEYMGIPRDSAKTAVSTAKLTTTNMTRVDGYS